MCCGLSDAGRQEEKEEPLCHDADGYSCFSSKLMILFDKSKPLSVLFCACGKTVVCLNQEPLQAEGGQLPCGVPDCTLRRVFEYSAASTQVRSARYAGGLRAARRGFALLRKLLSGSHDSVFSFAVDDFIRKSQALKGIIIVSLQTKNQSMEQNLIHQ